MPTSTHPFFNPVALACLALALTSGFASTAARAESTGEKSVYELDIEGMIAVRFYDSVREITGRLPNALEQIERNITDVERYIPNAEKYSSGYSNWRSLRLDSKSAAPLRVPNFYERQTATALRSARETLATDLSALNTLNATFVDYFKGTAAREEGFKKYNEAKPRLMELLAKVRADADALDSLALAPASLGEARTLPKNPCGIYIINMREVLDVARQISPLLDNPAIKTRSRDLPPETDAEKTARMALASSTAEKLDALAGQITALADKYKNTSTETISYRNESAVETSVRAVTRFYNDDCPGLVEQLGKISAELREKGAIRDYDRAGGRLRNLVSNHDRFVDMLNIWGGGTRAMKRARD